MQYRELGNTGLKVSEIGFGGEWLDGKTPQECRALAQRCREQGINIVDCWMSDPTVRSNLGYAIQGERDKWIIQGHIGSTWQNGQYERTRDMAKVRPAFEDLLGRIGTEYIDLGMIHYVDKVEDWEECAGGEFLAYVRELRESGAIRHVGLSTHNPVIGKLAARSGIVESIMFSVNPAFDMLPAIDDIDVLFAGEYDADLGGINRERAELYSLCEQLGVGITVMKPFAGGRLLDAAKSPFGVALTPVQCIHYCLTRPAVASVLGGYSTPEQVDGAVAYETADAEARDYATVLANAPSHTYSGQCTYCGHCKPCPMRIDIASVNKFYDLAAMQPEVPESVRQHYLALDVHADACVGCHSCETRCPFGVPIAQRMVEAREVFGC